MRVTLKGTRSQGSWRTRTFSLRLPQVQAGRGWGSGPVAPVPAHLLPTSQQEEMGGDRGRKEGDGPPFPVQITPSIFSANVSGSPQVISGLKATLSALPWPSPERRDQGRSRVFGGREPGPRPPLCLRSTRSALCSGHPGFSPAPAVLAGACAWGPPHFCSGLGHAPHPVPAELLPTCVAASGRMLGGPDGALGPERGPGRTAGPSREDQRLGEGRARPARTVPAPARGRALTGRELTVSLTGFWRRHGRPRTLAASPQPSLHLA